MVERHIAVISWYDTTYVPIAGAIHRHGLLGAFPGRSEADLYLWAANRSIRPQAYAAAPKSQPFPRTEAILSVITDLLIV
jgi:hypothetical protein